MAEVGQYLYAVCHGLDLAALADVPALDDGPLRIVEVDELHGVVSTVDLEEFGEEGLRANLERLDWVERTARGHDVVVRACSSAAPTAPMRLATIFVGEHSVRHHLRERYDALCTALRRVTGCGEWSVKVHAGGTTATTSTHEPAPTSGAAYLQRKRAAAEERHSAEERALAAAQDVDLALRDLAVGHRRLRAQDPRLSGVEGTMLLNGAYLVEEQASRAFAERVDELAEAHPEVAVEYAGPWPAYSFATLEQA